MALHLAACLERTRLVAASAAEPTGAQRQIDEQLGRIPAHRILVVNGRPALSGRQRSAWVEIGLLSHFFALPRSLEPYLAARKRLTGLRR